MVSLSTQAFTMSFHFPPFLCWHCPRYIKPHYLVSLIIQPAGIKLHIVLFPRNINLLLHTRLTACLIQIRYNLSLYTDMISSFSSCLSRKPFPKLLTSCLGLMPFLGNSRHHELFNTSCIYISTFYLVARQSHMLQVRLVNTS